MSGVEKRKVGERGQVTLPKELRDRLDIHGGDDVVVREQDGRIIIDKPVTPADLAEGYRQTATRARELDEEMRWASREANEYLGEAPDW
ncbi:AbrB/MazE/SpoVT family DNA-binding domain-containing protein [Halorarum halobium]|uniref:AbrB/MazE/SpoVT family DNA-binding domain-containing protein n=1 Tax=Halorarum halobium TaxID=3075121 RepID=UPI0028B1F237|nr:AbrB/MazE/SpoVT family DNA-binding domain-containing protein [Halobaculum sp. XH14]